MFGSYRYAVAAIVGWLALSGASPPNQTHVAGKAKAKHAPAPQISESPTPEPYAPYPRVDDPRCYQAANHDTADLCAQYRAAAAAEQTVRLGIWGNYIGAIGAVLSFVGTILVLIALAQTRKANRIAKRDYGAARLEARSAAKDTAQAMEYAKMTAEAAILQASVAKDMGIASTKAYLIVGSVAGRIDEAGRAHLDFEVVNAGSSPAIFVRVEWQLSIFFVAVGIPPNLSPPSEHFMPEMLSAIGAISPQGATSKQVAYEEKIDDLIQADLLARPCFMKVRVRTVYKDVFGQNNTEDFSFWRGSKPGEDFRIHREISPVPRLSS